MLARLAFKLATRKGGKTMIKMLEADPANPLNLDTYDLLIAAGKGVVHIAKEVIF
ncbi:hypothetical protein [Bacillus sp. AFS002410]|uniref:hypothetical protein n=1 Tax=Bacillus sp. AFS002410 TaxID=2033481 RepID=UPI0015CF4DBE|nr:hypothetical protein [Bacillus sp. AFS002410]